MGLIWALDEPAPGCEAWNRPAPGVPTAWVTGFPLKVTDLLLMGHLDGLRAAAYGRRWTAY